MLAGIELGGTKCVCVLGPSADEIVERVVIPTETPQRTLPALRAAMAGWRYDAIGIASFGPVELDTASPQFGTMLGGSKTSWRDANIRSLGDGVPLAIDTDVNAAALAEGRWGAAQWCDSWAYITIGTGIGAGVIVAGRPVTGLGHSEAGHQRIPRIAGDGFPGICPYHGDCVEGLASGPALAARHGGTVPALPIDDPALNATGHAIAMLCHNLVLTTLPQRIIIGGGVGLGQPHLLPAIRAHLGQSLSDYGFASRIMSALETYLVPAHLGGNAGPAGALLLAEQARDR